VLGERLAILFCYAISRAAKAISSVQEFGFDYTRITNPTNEVLENRLAALEGGSGALSIAFRGATRHPCGLGRAGVRSMPTVPCQAHRRTEDMNLLVRIDWFPIRVLSVRMGAMLHRTVFVEAVISRCSSVW
jgi:hypothetical protein